MKHLISDSDTFQAAVELSLQLTTATGLSNKQTLRLEFAQTKQQTIASLGEYLQRMVYNLLVVAATELTKPPGEDTSLD